MAPEPRTDTAPVSADQLEAHRAELHALCRRMLGSGEDAEDALQDALLRAWRGLPNFEGRSSVGTWLHRIATNACLDVIRRRPNWVLPIDYGPPVDPHDRRQARLAEPVWAEPTPDDPLALAEDQAAPEARYERREAVELAFIAAVHHLPPTQRGVLILREVLGFSAKETAEMLDTTVAAANSALQRARRTVAEHIPERSRQQTLRRLRDEHVRDVVEGFVDAWDRNDIEAVVAMLCRSPSDRPSAGVSSSASAVRLRREIARERSVR